MFLCRMSLTSIVKPGQGATSLSPGFIVNMNGLKRNSTQSKAHSPVFGPCPGARARTHCGCAWENQAHSFARAPPNWAEQTFGPSFCLGHGLSGNARDLS